MDYGILYPLGHSRLVGLVFASHRAEDDSSFGLDSGVGLAT